MRFEDIVARMEPLLEQLQNSLPYNAPTYKGLPEKGIYVFFERGAPMYIGRVGSTSKQTMRNRIRQHTIPSAEHNQAVFAFRLLQEKLGVATGHGAELSRAELAKKYKSEFKEMKERVRNMEVRAVEIKDSVTQAVFEIYASLALKTTRYNNFDTHWLSAGNSAPVPSGSTFLY